MTKGIIYVWNVNGVVKYVGRTVHTLDERTRAHITEYKKQLSSGNITTQKFIEVHKLENKWDEVEFSIIEEVSDLGKLGSRELYWYKKYNTDNQLWNSAIPFDTEYLILTEEEKYKKSVHKQLSKFIQREILESVWKIKKAISDKIHQLTFVEIEPNTFVLREQLSGERVEISLTELTITELSECVDNRLFGNILYELVTKDFYENYEKWHSAKPLDTDIVTEHFKDKLNKFTIEEQLEYYESTNKWKYSSKHEKHDKKVERNEFLRNFDKEYEELIKGNSRNWFIKRKPKDILDELFKKYSNSEFIATLMTYIRGKNTGGGQSFNMTTNKYKKISDLDREIIFDKYHYKNGGYKSFFGLDNNTTTYIINVRNKKK
ncbi:GIY-YIG nuclease family protein [Mycoplasmatota bacterium]|nr:GIY-YIG nuclease family protein [Mycoplasmatota bacterium]